MTYTTHRDTRETLQTLDRLDLDTDRPTEEDIMKKFGLDEEFRSGELNCWQRVKPRVWSLFDEPYSSTAAKVIIVVSWLARCKLLATLIVGQRVCLSVKTLYQLAFT